MDELERRRRLELLFAEHAGAVRAYPPEAWFIGFAPVDHPRVAIAVLVRNMPGGFGGKDAAPLAVQLLRALLPQVP